MIKTKEEILEKHYKNYQRRIPFDEQILDAMEEYANQFRQPVTELNERNSVDEGEKVCKGDIIGVVRYGGKYSPKIQLDE